MMTKLLCCLFILPGFASHAQLPSKPPVDTAVRDTSFMIMLTKKAKSHPQRILRRLKRHGLCVPGAGVKNENLAANVRGKAVLPRYLTVHYKNKKRPAAKTLRFLRSSSWIEDAGPIFTHKNGSTTVYTHRLRLRKKSGFSTAEIRACLKKQRLHATKEQLERQEYFTVYASSSFGSAQMFELQKQLLNSGKFIVVEIELITRITFF